MHVGRVILIIDLYIFSVNHIRLDIESSLACRQAGSG